MIPINQHCDVGKKLEVIELFSNLQLFNRVRGLYVYLIYGIHLVISFSVYNYHGLSCVINFYLKGSEMLDSVKFGQVLGD